VTPSGTLTRRVLSHCTSNGAPPQLWGAARAGGCYKLGVEREFSAGGVLIKAIRGRAMVAAIRPQGKPEGTWALPKGNIDPGETPAETAVREVLEETGVQGRLVEKLGDVKYTYSRRGGDRVFKIVSFYLLRAGPGRIGEIEEPMRIEVEEARWLPLDEAPSLLAYGGERQMAAKARDRFAP
jgi:8-oxo-dGTP pyrophosphatase MutT (NUDIX family)